MSAPSSNCTAEAVFVSAGDLATKYGVTSRTITGLAERGEIPALKVGFQWRFDPEAVHAALCSHTTAPFSPRIRRPKKSQPKP